MYYITESFEKFFKICFLYKGNVVFLNLIRKGVLKCEFEKFLKRVWNNFEKEF